MDSNKFPQEVFPKQYQALIQHLKKVSGFDTNLSSLSFLSASATTIGSTIKIDNGKYIDKPILWCVLVADSGTRKTHIMKKPFEFLQARDRDQFQIFKEALKNSSADDKPEKPKSTVLINTTMEAISGIHQNNPKGIILFKDEIIGMLKDFNKYHKGGGDKQELMELFNGNSLRVDRATKDTIYLPETCINIIGGIQPDRIKLLANEENLADGFFYRLLFSRVTENVPLSYSTESVNQSIVESSNFIYQSLFDREESILKVGKDSENLYAEWFNDSQKKYFNDPFGKALQSKLETYVWRFCIVLDVLDQISNDTSRPTIIPETMEKALMLAEYFRTESTEVYKETFREGILESEPVEFQRLYNKLENREYQRGELAEIFSKVWGADNIQKKLGCRELFTRTKHGVYIKTIRNVKK
jgi:hypothetical protein